MCATADAVLHSFPTRRSSDLRRFGAQQERAAQLHRGGNQRRQGEGRAVLDRKSTRLNSSHVSISYAVFCLKKKTVMISARSRKPTTRLSPLPGDLVVI